MFSIILIVGAAHGLFLVLVLLNICQGNALGQRFLAALTLVFVIDLFYEFLYQTEYFREVSFLLGLDEPLDFLYGSLIYFYVQTLTCPAATQSSGKLGLHVLPCLFAYVLELPFLMIDADQKLTVVYDEVEFDSPRMELVESLVDISTLISIIQIGVYLALSLRILGLHVRSIRARFSYLDRVNLV